MSGWIKLHRALIDWEWYTDHNTCRLFIHCLLRANHSDTKWRGQELKRGQFLTSLESLSSETGLSISQIRTGFKKLKSTNEIASLSQARSRIITVVHYNSYQSDDRLSDKLVAGSSQAGDRVVTTDKNVKNENKVIIRPDGINATAWNEWIAYRKSKKKKVSQKAAKKQFELLTNYAFEVQQQIIDQSIQNDYQGLFEPKGGSNAENRPNGHSATNRLSAVDRVRATAEKNRAARANNRDNLANAGGCVRVNAGDSVRGSDAGSLDSPLEGSYTVTDQGRVEQDSQS